MHAAKQEAIARTNSPRPSAPFSLRQPELPRVSNLQTVSIDIRWGDCPRLFHTTSPRRLLDSVPSGGVADTAALVIAARLSAIETIVVKWGRNHQLTSLLTYLSHLGDILE